MLSSLLAWAFMMAPGFDDYVNGRRRSIFDEAILYYDFEEKGGRDLCGDVRELFDNTEVGTPLTETSTPVQGAASMDSNTAGGCNADWSGAPWNSSSSHTIAIAFDAVDTATFQWVYDFGNLGTKSGMSIQNTSGNLRWHGAGGITDPVHTSPETAGVLRICMTVDLAGSPDDWSLYIGSGATADYTQSANMVNDNDFAIGVDKNGAIQHFTGLIDEFYVWDKVLTGAECELVNAGRP